MRIIPLPSLARAAFLGTLVVALNAPAGLRAQAPVVGAIEETLLFTVGTTATDAGGRPWAYLLWRAPVNANLAGRHFAVYRKAGPANSPASYQAQGVVSGVLSPAVIGVNLQRAERLGQDLAAFEQSLAAFEANLGLPSDGDRATRTARMLQSALSQAGMSSSIHALAASSPALALSLGIAWAGPIPPGASTYELREWDPVACVDKGVAGRITLQAGVIVPLPAPAPPLQVPDLSNSGDRSVSLRWATPDDLRRRALLAHGFTLWRVPWNAAVARGWNAAAPTTAELLASTANGVVTRMNDLPFFPAKTLDAAQAADFTGDPDTFFFVDNNGRFDNPPGLPHPDGAEFGYLLTARDLLGREGVPSAAGHGRACRTVAPQCPVAFEVAILFDDPVMPGKQIARLTWTPDADPDLPPAMRYEIYRGTDQTDLNLPGPNPARLIATVNRPPGATVMTYDDLSFNQNGNSEEHFYGQTFWYAVRAIHDGACGPLLSPTCPPVFGTLCDHRPPSAPVGGTVIGSCPQPVVISTRSTVVLIADEPPPLDADYYFRMQCQRRDVGVEWAEFSIETQDGPRDLGRYYFGGESDTVEADLSLAPGELHPGNSIPVWKCRVGNGASHFSNLAQTSYRPAAPDHTQRVILPFLCGAQSPATLDLDDPLSSPLSLGVGFLAGVTAPDRDGWVVAPGLTPGLEYVVTRGDGAATDEIDWGVADAAGTLVFQDSALGERTPAEVGFVYRAWRFVRASPCPADPPHQFLNALTGKLIPIRLCVPKRPEALEYRLFRRVDNGPLTLFAQGLVTPSAGPICRSDDGLVSHGACITYFAQFIGKNGASSSLAVLGCKTLCVEPPVPVLVPPLPIGDAANPRFELRWSCPPHGVDRFEIFLIPQDGAPLPPSQLAGSSLFLRATSLARDAAIFGVGVPSFMKFTALNNTTKYFALQEKILTPRVGTGGLGAGPAFTLTVPVTLGQEYRVSVRALATGATCSGKQSLQYTAKWEPAPQLPDRSVVWPSRPLPAASPDSTGAIAAFPLHDFDSFGAQFRTIYPVEKNAAAAGVRIGRMPGVFDANPTEDGQFEYYPGSGTFDPEAYLFPRPGAAGRKCLPAVLYRQQVANPVWPVVSGDVLQVSPLVKKLSWHANQFAGFLNDPFLAVQRADFTLIGGDTTITNFYLYLLDTTPVVRGASYRYWMVCFTDHGEPDVVVTSAPVTIPATP